MNRADLRAAIRALGFETDTDSAQNEAIKQADRRINAIQRWRWLESTTAALTIAQGATDVSALPADFLHPDAMRVEVTGAEYDMKYKAPQEVRQLLHLDRDEGVPLYWTFYNGTISVYPRADAQYTVALDYMKSPPGLNVDTDSPPAPALYHDVWVWAAVSFLAARQRDWSFHQFAERQFEQRLADMARSLGIKQRQTSGEVERSDFWQQVNVGYG